MKAKETAFIEKNEVAEWSESELTEMRDRSLKMSLLLLGLITWGTSFRFWESAQLRQGAFFLSACFTLCLTLLALKKKGMVVAIWVSFVGTILSICIDLVSLPGSSAWIWLAWPIVQSGILFGSTIAVLVGALEILLIVLLNIFFSANIPYDPVAFYIIGISVLIWYISRLIYTSIYQTAIYALKNRDALNEARNHQGKLVRAVKNMEENSVRLVKAYDVGAILQHEADLSRQQKVQFANMISHEMRAPLNFIIGASDLMVKSPKIYGEVAWPVGLYEDIQRIYQSSQYLNNLINDVLALGQIEANKMVLNFTPYQISDIFDEVLSILGATFENSSLFLDVQVDPDVPRIKLDRVRIRQVMLNLITNAFRHTQKGGVKVRAKLDGENILIYVEDTGSGISPEHLANLFQEFYQGDQESGNEDYQTSGLGLTICKQFVELHGGWIWTESPIQEPHDGQGVGSRFSFSLPLSSVSMLQTLWVGRNDDYYKRRERSLSALKSVLVYSTSHSVLPSQLPITLSGYQLAHCATDDELIQAIDQYHPCGVIQISDDNDHFQELHLPPDILSVRCQLQLETVDLEDMWDGYLTKPSTPDQICICLKSIGVTPNTCLVIDDDVNVSRFIELTFLSAGMDVDVRYAETGAKGLDMMQSFLPDITFVDINLPDMTGWNVIKIVRDTPQISDLPVVIFSAIDNPKPVVMKLQALELQTPSGLNSYITSDILQGIFDSIPGRL